MNKKIYFIRHAKSLGNIDWDLNQKDDSPLHESGKNESLQALKRLKKIPFDMVISSDLKRCKETAEILLGKNKNKIIYNELFREISHNESFTDFKKRISKAKIYIESIEKEKILIVTHSQFMKMFLAQTLYSNVTEKLYRSMHDFFRVVNTGISVFNCNSTGQFKGWQLRSWNEHSHLD